MPKKTAKTLHIHDHAFRQAMSDPRVAKDFLKSYLPADIQENVNFDTLQLRKESYIDEDLKLLITDVLYSVELKDKTKALIYFLMEHLSSPQKLAPWRMLKYTCQIIEQGLKETQSETLPLVIPIVIFNGVSKYPYSVSIYDLFGEKEKLLAKRYMFDSFQLIDFSQISDETMKSHQWSALMEILLKHSASRDMINKLENLSERIKALADQNADSYILAMLKYVIELTEIHDKERFTHFLQKSLPKPLETKAMTLAQVWEEEGFQKGMQQGEKDLLVRQLTRRFSAVPAKYLDRLDQYDPDALLTVGEKILDAKTIDEIFEDLD